MSRLVVVSNRVALPDETRAGGLAVALRAALAEHGGLWFGWSGRIAEETAAPRYHEHEGIGYLTVDLGRADHAGYYVGFANRVLWPLLHDRVDLMEFAREDYQVYREVNRDLAQALKPRLRADDSIWVHDYHLIPLAAELRRLGCRQRLGFFLHTALAPAALLEYMPCHRDLLDTLADYDLIGVQSSHDLASLRDYLTRVSGARPDGAGAAVLQLPDGRRTRIGAFPIGIDAAAIRHAAQRARGSAALKRMRASLGERSLIVGVDRLDYSKGLAERFQSFGQLIEQHAHWRGRVSLLQIAPTSRGEVPEYRAIRRELERIAGHINGRHADPDWVPIRYVNRAYPHTTLCGYYRLARVGLVTPLRDGMNLVAKEYLASQDAENPGVLVLSEFAGAARQLDTALAVNPRDHLAVATALDRALAMPLEERKARWQSAMRVIEHDDITAWRKMFLGRLRAAAEAR